jgi:hypothetical protein
MLSFTEVLASRRTRILRRWTERIRREHAPPGWGRGGRREELPNILEDLVTALSAAKGQSAVSPLPPESPASASRELQRLRDGFEIEAVVRQYGILVDILLDELAATGATLNTEEWQPVVEATPRQAGRT